MAKSGGIDDLLQVRPSHVAMYVTLRNGIVKSRSKCWK
jgi:hypothetical protein